MGHSERRQFGRFGLAGAAFLLGMAVSVAEAYPAAATDCTTAVEQGYWVRSSDFPTFGTQGNVVQADRALAVDCTNANNHHTIHTRDSSFSNFVEAGYVERWGPNSSHMFSIWWELRVGGVIIGDFDDGFTIGCCNTLGFRIVNVSGSNYWKFFSKGSSGSYTQFGPSGGRDAGFHQAYPYGEDARRGDPGTSAADSHSALRYKAVRTCTSNCWTSAWSTNFVGQGCIPKWSYSFVAKDAFKVVSDSTKTC